MPIPPTLNRADSRTASITSNDQSLDGAPVDLTTARAFALAGRREAESDMLGASVQPQLSKGSSSGASPVTEHGVRHGRTVALIINHQHTHSAPAPLGVAKSVHVSVHASGSTQLASSGFSTVQSRTGRLQTWAAEPWLSFLHSAACQNIGSCGFRLSLDCHRRRFGSVSTVALKAPAHAGEVVQRLRHEQGSASTSSFRPAGELNECCQATIQQRMAGKL